MRNIQTTTEIIDLLGGNHAVAALTDASAKAVSNWRAAGTFPSNTYLLIKSELLRHGITAPDNLWSMRELPPVKRKRSA
jgi:hypothetical protein